MRLEEKKYYRLSPIEIIKDLKKKKNLDKFTLEFLQTEIKNAQGKVPDFWFYKLISSYVDITKYEVK